MLLATLLIASGSGCRSIFEKPVVIPEMPTAREQAEVAERQFRDAMRTTKEKGRDKELEKAAKAFATVEKNFPDDQEYTPGSVLREGEVYLAAERYSDAITEFRRAIAKYDEIPDVHAGALFGLAETQEKMGDVNASKDTYRQLIDLYGTSAVPYIKDRVARARIQYKRIL